MLISSCRLAPAPSLSWSVTVLTERCLALKVSAKSASSGGMNQGSLRTDCAAIGYATKEHSIPQQQGCRDLVCEIVGAPRAVDVSAFSNLSAQVGIKGLFIRDLMRTSYLYL